MKKILIVSLALILVACGAPAPTATQQPTSAPVEPTQTAAVILQTVVVTVIPTQAPTEVPSATPLPPPTEVPPTPTQVPPPTQAPATQAPATQPPAAAEASTGGPIKVDDALGAGWFTNMTRDRNDFSLRCQLNKQITFSTKPTSPDIKLVDFWYRIEDRSTGAVFDWQNAGKMIPDNEGNFTIVFTGDEVNANFRKPNAWFDYQFVGYNPTGVVGRSEKIQRLVSYTFDCP